MGGWEEEREGEHWLISEMKGETVRKKESAKVRKELITVQEQEGRAEKEVCEGGEMNGDTDLSPPPPHPVL